MTDLIKRLKAGLGTVPRKKTVPTPWGLTIQGAVDEIEQLRTALRQFAIKQHVRMVSGGGTIPNGGSCELCKTEWRNDQPEAHRASCLLAQGR